MPKRSVGGKLVRVFLGLLCGAAIAECGFRMRDGGAFPHLNIYDPDAKLGVTLRPGASEQVAFGGNPRTSIRIGAAGLRGEVPSSIGVDEILVVGDSQVFGLGVEEAETFSKRLAMKHGKTVINAGIPTYGPLEYQAVLETWIPKRKPKTVIYVVNLANDLVEAKKPNTTRHAVWDGWAVRKETAPESVVSFPGRALLFRESHAVFAWRRWVHGSSRPDDQPLPSEGTATDLLDAANAANRAHESTDQQALDEWLKAMKDASSEAQASQKKLESAASSAYPDVFEGEGGKAYLRTHGHPGDIVSEKVRLSEADTGPVNRVKVVLQGAKVREEIETILKKRAEAEIEKEEAKAILAGFDERAKIEKKITQLRALPAKLARAHSPMFVPIEQAQALCQKNGARLVVVVLPMDVQVSPDEWTKYGSERVDLAPAQILVDDVVHAAEGLSVSVLDATKALRAAEPGAFLNADLHMSPKGHQALADAIDAKMAEPPPFAATVSVGPALGYAKVCACQKRLHPEIGCGSLEQRPDLDCLRTYSGDCPQLLACVKGEASALPKCLTGWQTSGEHHRCFKTCVVGEPCVAGRCTKTTTGQVCL